ncbi:MAG: translocation/assembly module TamB domain-containing protein [Verrucomicrobiota bacterium JB023]|nr:translocation/assembly module TamB domain-containing protein [Verrucomicrobiota bacterium JB023]
MIALILWLGGPGFRWIANTYGPGFLEKAGFEADFEISGSLWSGPLIESLELSSETSPLKSLQAENLQLDYDLLELKDLKLNSLTADSLVIDLDLSQSSPKEEEEPKESTPLPELLEKYRGIALHPEIQVRSLDLHIHRAEENYYRLEQASLAHAAGSDTITLDHGTLTDFQNKVSQPPDASITWTEGQFDIASFTAARDVSIESLAAQYQPAYAADGTIRLMDSLLQIQSDGATFARATLANPPLALEPFYQFLPEPPPLTTRLNALQAEIRNFKEPFANWEAALSLGLEATEWQSRGLPDLQVELQKQGLTANSNLVFSLSDEPVTLAILAQLPADLIESSSAWQKLSFDLEAGIPSVDSLLTTLQPHFDLSPPDDGWPSGATSLTATVALAEEGLGPTDARLDLTNLNWGEADFPRGELNLALDSLDSPVEATLRLEQDEDSFLRAEATYQQESQTYQGVIEAERFLADALQPFIGLANPDLSLSGTISLDWEGSGSLQEQDSHQGALTVEETRLVVQDQPPVSIDLRGSYNGLSRVTIPTLELSQTDQRFTGSLSWDGQRLDVPRLAIDKAGQEILTGKASLPLDPDQLDPEAYLAQTEAWNLELTANRLNIPETAALFALPVPEGLDGIVSVETRVTGSPAQPSLDGRLQLNDATYESVSQLPPTDASLSWATAGKSLTIGGTITPAGRETIAIEGNTGFRPRQWVEEPDSFLAEPFNFRASAPSVDLGEVTTLSPVVKSVTGTASVEITANGTFRSPVIEGSLEVDMPRARLDLPRFDRLRETTLRARFSGQTITILPSTLAAEGGVFDISGTVGIADTSNPTLDLTLEADNALVWRDDNINSRADARIRLRGPMDSARLEAEIGVVESLFYKDVELLPVGVPVSVPKAPSLPSLGRPSRGGGARIPLPEPFASWTISARATTTDPFLVRGNLTEGQVTGAVNASGTLGRPQLDGTLTIRDFSANLPFSKLTIDGGQAIFTPGGGFIPSLEILAESRISPYDIDLFVSGKATSPEIAFTSSPPLPENEIITLLATGVTPEGLEDTDTARNKLFQLLIERVRLAPPGTFTYKYLRPLAEPLKDVEFQVAGSDPFTGKKRNSITVPVPETEKWFVSASVDSENNTRLLTRYVLQFGGPDRPSDDTDVSPRTPPADGGGRTQVRIVGLQGMTEEEVLTQLAGRLDFITSRPPDRASADDADFLVRRLLEKEGYSAVNLTWRIPADRQSIVLTVDSGPRYTIDEVNFIGAPDESEEEMTLYYTGSTLLGDTETPYIQSEVEEATDSARDYLRSLGYWKASITINEPTFDEAKRTVDLSLTVNPGALHTISSLTIEGTIPEDEETIRSLLNSYIGREATASTLRQLRERPAARLRDRGFQFVETFLAAEHENGQTRLTLGVDPGRKYRLRRAVLSGAPDIDLDRVQKRLDRQIGEPYDQETIDRVQKTLQATGAFESVNTERETNREDGTITATLHLQEGDPQGFSYNLGAGSFEGFIVGASYYDRNFLDKLYNFNAAAEYSGIGFLGEVSVTDPFFLGYDLRATPRAFILSRTYDEYSKLESGLGFTLGYDIDDRNQLELDSLLSFSTVSGEDLSTESLGATNYLLATVGATWIYDDRDSPVSPGEGFYSRVRAEFGGVGADTPNLFLRLEAQAAYHWPIGDRSRLAFNLRTGLLSPLDGTGFPVDLRYFLGGADSVRSFPSRELGPKSDGVPRGGQSFWYGNVEYVRQLAGVLYGVAFFDAGSLDESSLNWPSFDPKLAVGMGLRVDLPIGPIRLEYGHALNPADEDPAGAFHFSIGASF